MFAATQMLDPETGNPHTAHTTNPVPFITSFPLKQEGGCLADVAPTVLAVMVGPRSIQSIDSLVMKLTSIVVPGGNRRACLNPRP